MNVCISPADPEARPVDRPAPATPLTPPDPAPFEEVGKDMYIYMCVNTYMYRNSYICIFV